jgi:type IV secretion system protein VirD4
MSNKTTSQKWSDNSLLIAGIVILCLILGYFISFWIPVIAGVIGLIIRSSNKATEKDKIKDSFNRFNIEQFKSLGETKEERDKNIRKMFDNKDGTLRFGTWYEYEASVQNPNGATFYTKKYTSLRFKISRHIAAMEQREREFLKTTLLLFNEERLNYNQYKYYLLAFIYGNGKTSIDTWSYENSYDGFKDGPGVVKYYVEQSDASVDSAINSLIQVMDPKDKSRLVGGNSWLDADEIEGTVYNGEGNYLLTLGHLENSEKVLHYSGEGSLITIAPPGSGKTQCFVIPNMLNWKGAAVVLDIKGEIYEATHKWREENVGKVYKFSPLDPINSNSYNPLTFVRDDTDYIWEDSRFVADMMIVPSGAQDPFWENKARDVLTASIAYVTFSNEVNDRAMSKVLDIIYGIGWDEMITSLKSNALVPAMRQTGQSLSSMDAKQRESVLQTAQSSLSAWQGARIAKVTNKSDWNPINLQDEKATVYICVKYEEIESFLSVLRVFIAQHLQILSSRKGSVPILFMLDEFPQLKRMIPIEKALEVGRQYGIKLWMFAQSYGQLKKHYQETAEMLLGSCVIRTFMNLPLNEEITTKISDQLGYRHDALGNTKEKLVEPIELAGPNYRDYILVLATGTKPAKVKKKFAYQDAEIMSKMI